jgi:hypothetical protein
MVICPRKRNKYNSRDYGVLKTAKPTQWAVLGV